MSGGLADSDFEDSDVVSERELISRGTLGAPYRSDSVNDVVGGVVTLDLSIPMRGYDDPVQVGDLFTLSGATAGDGVYTVDAITGDFSFTVVEAIPDSTGGTGEFQFASGARMVGVDSGGMSNASADELQAVLEQLDAAIVGGGGSIFGQQFQVEVSKAEDLTTSGIYQDKLTLTTPNLPAGDYVLFFYYVVSGSANNTRTETRLRRNAVNVLDVNQRAAVSSADIVNGGFENLSGISGVSVFALQYRKSGGSGVSSISNAHLAIWRTA